MTDNRRAADGVLEVHPTVEAGAKQPPPPGVADTTPEAEAREETLLRDGGEATGALGGEDLTPEQRDAAGLRPDTGVADGGAGDATATRGLASGPDD